MSSIDYAARRSNLARRMRADGGGVLVLFAAATYLRNGDVEHDYRQDSDFFYLTGFDEPESVLVFDADTEQGSLHLFVRERDPAREIWDGPRTGVEGAVSKHGAARAFSIKDLQTELPKLIENKDRLVYAWGSSAPNDAVVQGAISSLRRRFRAGVWPPTVTVDPGVYLHAMRSIKSEQEVDLMREAAALTHVGHVACMRAAKDGMAEYELDSILLSAFRAGGSERVAYASIVGSGPNATILHYRAGNRRMRDGELVLIDAGSEYGGYASDVTRTFPVSGTFSAEQRAIYEIVLKAEEEAIQMVRPGATIDDVHNRAVRVLCEGLIELGLLQGKVDDVIANESYRRFYMHRTSHWLGMDVHDVGSYAVRGQQRTFEPGMVLTVEPGIYIAADEATVDARWRGIGVRIEDDILVTASGFDNLTASIPKTVAAVEAACGHT